MFGFRFSVRSAAALLIAFFLVNAGTSLEAQSTARRKRETNANRKARIERTIQDTYSHRWEMAGGGGYLRFKSGDDLQRNNEVTFFLSGTYFLNPRFGIMGQVGGAYGNAKVGNTIYNIENPQISQYYFQGGPAYRLYAKQNYAATVFAIGGAGLGKFDSGSKGIPAVNLGLYPSQTRAAFQVGVNLDYNFYPNLAMRVTPLYQGTTFGNSIQNNLGVNMGIVYRFGRIK